MSEHAYLIGREVTFRNYRTKEEFEVRVAGAHRDVGVTLKYLEGKQPDWSRNKDGNAFCLNKEEHGNGVEGIPYNEYYDMVVGQIILGTVDVRLHAGVAEYYDDMGSGGGGVTCAFQ